MYTLYNFAGGLSKNEFSFSTDELEAMYQPSVEIEGESEQTVYLFFCIAVQSNGEIEKYYNDYKKDLERAVIQADITEVDIVKAGAYHEKKIYHTHSYNFIIYKHICHWMYPKADFGYTESFN